PRPATADRHPTRDRTVAVTFRPLASHPPNVALPRPVSCVGTFHWRIPAIADILCQQNDSLHRSYPFTHVRGVRKIGCPFDSRLSLPSTTVRPFSSVQGSE